MRRRKAQQANPHAIQVGLGERMVAPAEIERRINNGSIEVIKARDVHGLPIYNKDGLITYCFKHRSISLGGYTIVCEGRIEPGLQISTTRGVFRLVPDSASSNGDRGVSAEGQKRTDIGDLVEDMVALGLRTKQAQTEAKDSQDEDATLTTMATAGTASSSESSASEAAQTVTVASLARQLSELTAVVQQEAAARKATDAAIARCLTLVNEKLEANDGSSDDAKQLRPSAFIA